MKQTNNSIIQLLNYIYISLQGIVESDGSFTGDIFKHDSFGEYCLVNVIARRLRLLHGKYWPNIDCLNNLYWSI